MRAEVLVDQDRPSPMWELGATNSPDGSAIDGHWGVHTVDFPETNVFPMSEDRLVASHHIASCTTSSL